MSRLAQEIRQYMIGFVREERTATSRFVFPETFIGFHGHFPKHKILPGVCQILCAVSTLEQSGQKTADILEVVLAKYYAPILPDEEITCCCSDIKDSGEFIFKTIITKGIAKVAELKLRVAFS